MLQTNKNLPLKFIGLGLDQEIEHGHFSLVVEHPLRKRQVVDSIRHVAVFAGFVSHCGQQLKRENRTLDLAPKARIAPLDHWPVAM